VRTAEVLHERRFLLAMDTGGDPAALVDHWGSGNLPVLVINYARLPG
jgi:hypothetical protein